jgi:hypothetical protein
MSGTIPASLGSLTSLSTLDLSSNFLNGTVSDSLGAIMQQAWTLFRLDGNLLSGTVPAWLGNYSGTQLGLSNNQFGGNLPASLAAFPFNVKYVVCDTFFYNTSCTYFNITDSLDYMPIQPTVVNVPGAILTSCPAGTYRSGADTTLNGTLYYPAPICSPCAPGTAALLPNTPLCTPCPAGSAPTANASACSPCPVGTFLNATTLRCDVCPLGTSAPSPGSSSCLANAVGFKTVVLHTVASVLGISGVAASDFGGAQNATLLSAITSTLSIPASAVFITSVSDGAARRHLFAASLQAFFSVTSKNGTEAARINSSIDVASSFGASISMQLRSSSDAVFSHVAPSAVSVAPPTLSVAAGSSEACPIGTYLSSQSWDCEVCPIGLVSLSTAATLCTPCPAGNAPAANASACLPCPSGTYLNPTSQSCQNCLPGTSAPTPGSIACAANPAGFISVTQTTVSSATSLGGVTVFGPSENATLLSSLADLLSVSAADVQITSASATARRLAAAALTVQFAVVTTAEAPHIIAALNDTASFSASLAASLHASNSSLAGVTSVVVAPSQVQTVGLAAQPCAAGTVLNATSQSCQACAPGSYSPSPGAPSCQLCAPSTYSLNATHCQTCPEASASSSGTTSLLQCLCAYGYYQAALSSASFTCTKCPNGALCSGDATPLATDGFWHAPGDVSAFFDCEDGWCIAEQALPASAERRLLEEEMGNCRAGHSGVVCGECIEGWTLQSQFCAPCPVNSALSSIPRSHLAGYIILACVIFCGVSLPLLLAPLVRPKERLKSLSWTLSSLVAAGGSAYPKLERHSVSLTKRLFAVAEFCRVPLRLVTENLQIISSFKRTMRLAWPHVFNRLVLRLSFLCAQSLSARVLHSPLLPQEL